MHHLRRELANALHQVLVRLAIAGYQLADRRDHGERVHVVPASARGGFSRQIVSGYAKLQQQLATTVERLKEGARGRGGTRMEVKGGARACHTSKREPLTDR